MSADALNWGIALDHEQETDEAEVDDKESLLPPIICYRDPAGRAHHQEAIPITDACCSLQLPAVVGVVYKSIKRPDRIVVDMSFFAS